MDNLTRLPFAILLLAACGAAAARDDLPYVATPDNVTLAMLELAKVGPDDFVIDLGSGDGRIVIAAAKRFGARGLGVDIDAGLVQVSRESARRAGVAGRVEFRVEDLFLTDLASATVITLYLLPEVNLQLRPHLLALKPGTRIVSHDWDMGAWKPERTVNIETPRKSSRALLWIVPARLSGAWCGIGAARGTRLEITQQFQEARGTIHAADPRRASADGGRSFEARIEGAMLRSGKDRRGQILLRLEGEGLRVTFARGVFARWRQAAFERSAGPGCA
jgi:SAM-dependent methyltransferase